MIELYHNGTSAASLKLLIALKEIGLDSANHHVDPQTLQNWSEAYRKLAPQGQLPVLIDDGEVMNESQFALQYLAEAYGDHWLAPSDPLGWYDVQAWLNVIEPALGPNVSLLGWQQTTTAEARDAYRAGLAAVPNREKPAGWNAVVLDAEASEDQLENAREKTAHALAKIEAALAENDWVASPDYSIADISTFALVRTLPRLLSDMVNATNTPKLLAWLERINARPAVKAALAAAGGEERYDPPA